MLEVFRRSPQQKSAGDVPFGEIRVDFNCALAVELSLFKPNTGRIEFEMASRTRKRECGVGEGKSRVSSHSVSQVTNRIDHQRRITADAKSIAPHEFRIGQRFPAIPWTLLDYPWSQRPVKHARDLLCNLALDVRHTVHVEIAFPCEASALQQCVKHFERETPLPF